MAPPPLIPLRHFFDNPERALSRISPDGRRLAYLAPEAGRLNVWVRTLGRDDDRAVTHDQERGVMSYVWSRDSSRILYLRDKGGDENAHLFAAELDRPQDDARDLTPWDGVRVGLVDVPRARPGEVLISANRRDPTLFDVSRLDLASGRVEPVAENPGNIIGWVADRDGALRAAYAQTPAGDHQVLFRGSEAEPFRVVAEYANEDDGYPYAFTPDGSALWLGSARGVDLRRLVELDPATGDERPVDADEEVDLLGPVLSERTGDLLGAVYRRDRVVLHAFDEALARDWDRLRELHPGDPAITGEDAEETTWVVAFDDDRDPGATYLYDRASGGAEFLHRPRPWLDPETLAPMRPVRITSRDGLALRSYLTLPLGVPPRDLPTVLLVHGGPWARDSWGYHAETQFLANRGYAVLQVNYRGSSGFGKAFSHAAEHEFAGRMHDDLIDAVRWAVDEGIADPARVGIYGGSYGGYATLVGADLHAGGLRRRGQLRRPLEPGHADPLLPALLAAAAGRHLVPLRRRPGRPGAARRPGGALPAQPGRRDPRAAAGDPGRERPAGHQGRVRPDRRRAPWAGRRRSSTSSRRTRATAS